MYTTQQQNAVIASATALRRRAFALDLELGARFAVGLSRGWRRQGVDGVRSACWDLAAELADVAGAWDLYVAARDLAAA